MKRQNLVILIFISLVFAGSIPANAQDLETTNPLKLNAPSDGDVEKEIAVRFKEEYFLSISSSSTQRQSRKAWLENKLARDQSDNPLEGKFVSDSLFTGRLTSTEFSHLKSLKEVYAFENRL